MVLDEEELRNRLAAAAAHADAPRFNVDGLIHRIRRRRARILGLAAGSLLAAAAIGVGVPVALSATPAPPPAASPWTSPLQPSFAVAVNGQSRTLPQQGSVPRFTVTPGERLSIRISVTVQAHANVTALWLGIAEDGVSSPGTAGQQPAGMRPVFSHAGRLLTPGLHTFAATWSVPTQVPGATLWISAAWEQKDSRIGRPVAELVTPQ